MTPLLARKGFHYAARRFGWPALRQAAMNARFASGQWANYKEPAQMVALVERYAQAGRITVLGCGGNPLGRQLDPQSYSEMIGVDLSPDGIAIAQADAPERQTFHVADMTDWRTQQWQDLVVFSESIYYVSLPKILPMLEYWADRLTWRGEIVATFAFPEQHPEVMQVIRQHFHILEDRPLVAGEKRHVIVFN